MQPMTKEMPQPQFRDTDHAAPPPPPARDCTIIDCGLIVGVLASGSIVWIALVAAVATVVGWLGGPGDSPIWGRVMFTPTWVAMAAVCWPAVWFRLRIRRVRSAAWWTMFSMLPTLLALQFAGVL